MVDGTWASGVKDWRFKPRLRNTKDLSNGTFHSLDIPTMYRYFKHGGGRNAFSNFLLWKLE